MRNEPAPEEAAARKMASLTYELGLRKDIFANQGKDEDGDGDGRRRLQSEVDLAPSKC